MSFDSLLTRITNCDATVAIMGMGYVGFPLAIATHAKGYRVIAYDVDTMKIDSLNAGKSYLKGIDDSAVTTLMSDGKFIATADASALRDADIIILCVPTPLTKHREPDMTYVVATTDGRRGVPRP